MQCDLLSSYQKCNEVIKIHTFIQTSLYLKIKTISKRSISSDGTSFYLWICEAPCKTISIILFRIDFRLDGQKLGKATITTMTTVTNASTCRYRKLDRVIRGTGRPRFHPLLSLLLLLFHPPIIRIPSLKTPTLSLSLSFSASLSFLVSFSLSLFLFSATTLLLPTNLHATVSFACGMNLLWMTYRITQRYHCVLLIPSGSNKI